ncbi:surface-adhesin E family protein [Rhodoferax sp. U11-2br]|uniref:surface-adhesin E family protein n=1 Tax=Rhodoferax sp. U11-2br TaxID=2838878 RepID=UPI001BE61294|nr:surface-adhesin E family protein [Rhodoferax sp. U11-2br]MBT3068767.1 hypothetical protein [Rhodoferax sp. U11-2br]
MKYQYFAASALLMLTLGLLHSPVWATNWKLLHETQNGSVSFDVDSVSRSKQLVKIRKRVVFNTPHKSLIASPNYEYIATVSLEEYDCENQTVRTIEALNVLKNGAKNPAELRMSDAMPLIGPYMEEELFFACTTKSD